MSSARQRRSDAHGSIKIGIKAKARASSTSEPAAEFQQRHAENGAVSASRKLPTTCGHDRRDSLPLRADIEPFFHLARVFCRSCALSLPCLAHQHVGQSNAIDVRLLPAQCRHKPLHHRLVRAHRVVLRPSRNVGHACPTIAALAKHLAIRHSINHGCVLRDAGGACAQRVRNFPIVGVR